MNRMQLIGAAERSYSQISIGDLILSCVARSRKFEKEQLHTLIWTNGQESVPGLSAEMSLSRFGVQFWLPAEEILMKKNIRNVATTDTMQLLARSVTVTDCVHKYDRSVARMRSYMTVL